MLIKKLLRQLAAYGRVWNRTRMLWFSGACVTGQRWNTFCGTSWRSRLNQEAMLTRKTRSTTNFASTRSSILSEGSSWQKRATRVLRMTSRYRNSHISTMSCFRFMYTRSSCNNCKVNPQKQKIKKRNIFLSIDRETRYRLCTRRVLALHSMSGHTWAIYTWSYGPWHECGARDCGKAVNLATSICVSFGLTLRNKLHPCLTEATLNGSMVQSCVQQTSYRT